MKSKTGSIAIRSFFSLLNAPFLRVFEPRKEFLAMLVYAAPLPSRIDPMIARPRYRLKRNALIALIALILSSPPLLSQQSPEHRYALKQLELRAAEQQETAKTLQSFHAFSFFDKIQDSGITFRHKIVDDAGKTYKAAHYDHGNGVAVADVDGDSLLDLYFTTQLGVNELWRNLGNSRFENITPRARIGLPNQIVVAAAFADTDNDGDPDLFVTTVRRGNHFFENQGNGTFRDRTQDAGLDYRGHSSGAVFFDFDRDGKLDLFVTNVGKYTKEKRGRGGFYQALPDAFSGHLFPDRTESSILYRNLGNNRFGDVTKELNLRDNSWSGDCTITDFNRDGFPDLYIVNMQGDDHYYENQGGKRFVDRTKDFFPKTPWGAMGAKFFDYDRDGHLDLYLTDMHSDMTQGQTVDALKFSVKNEKAKSEAYCSIQWTDEYLQGAANNIFGNAFYRNLGNGRFEEMSDRLNVETYWPWGFSVGDLNADGFEDLFVTAGMGYPFRYGVNSVLLNNEGTGFIDAEFTLGVEPRLQARTEQVWFSLDCDGRDKGHAECEGKSGRINVLGTLSSRSSAIIDLDNDGDLDIVTNEFNDKPQVLISNLSERKAVKHLSISLVGTKSNRDGVGAIVRVETGGTTMTQINDGKTGYLAQSSVPMYFGLGTASTVDRITVHWPSGTKQIYRAPFQVNERITLREE